MDQNATLESYNEHCARMFYVEFEWSSNELPELPPTALHHGTGSEFALIQHWCAVDASLHWWPNAHHRHPRGVYLQAQDIKGSKSTWRRPSCLLLMVAMMSKRNPAITPVLSAVVVSAASLSRAHPEKTIMCAPWKDTEIYYKYR